MDKNKGGRPAYAPKPQDAEFVKVVAGHNIHLAFIEDCSYDDGMHVIASTTAELGSSSIIKQTIVQAWDS